MIDSKRLCIIAVALLAVQGCSSEESADDFAQTNSAASMRDFGQIGGLPWDTSKTLDVTDTTPLAMRYGNTVGIGDFNGDGKIDIASSVMPENQPGMLDIAWANGKHDRYTMKPDATKPDRFGHKLLAGKFCPSLEATGDMIVASAPDYGSGNGGFGIFYRKNKVFKTWRRLTGATSNQHIGTQFAIGDVDGDGKLDLVYQATPKDSAAYIAVQYDFCSINGTINAQNKLSSGHIGDVLNVAKLNDAPEVIAVDNESHAIYFLKDDLSESRPSFKTEARVSAIEFADLDGDGMLDMIVAESDDSDGKGRITAYRNPGAGKGFDAEDIIWHGVGSDSNAHLGESLVLSDVNADGVVDLVAAAPGSDALPGFVFVYMGTMDKSVFSQPYWTYQGETSGFGTALAVGDINKAGWLDIAVGSPNQGQNGTVTAFLQTETPCYIASKCLVGGECYDAGDMGENACEICNPNEDNFGFTPPVCDVPQGNVCMTGTCDPQVGCVTAPVKDGTACGEPVCSSQTTQTIHAC